MGIFASFSSISRSFGFTGLPLNDQASRTWTTQQIGTTAPIWIDTTNKWILYREIPELMSVVNRYAKMMSSAMPIVVNDKGEVIGPDQSNHWIFNLIDRPNAMQSWSNMIYMTGINKAVTNNALIYAPKLTLGARQNLTPLAWNNVKVVPTGKKLQQTTIDGFIKEFKIPTSEHGQFDTFEPNEIIYITDPDGINLFDTASKLDSLKYPLSNIAAGYKKRNVLLVNLFSLGILSADNSDGISAIPIDPNDVKTLRDDMKKRHDGEVIITDKPFSFDPMTFPVKDLMLFEEMTADKLAIIDAFGLNEHMFGHGEGGKGSTFSNVESGERQAYNSTIIPDTEILYAEFTKQLGLEEDGLFLIPDFSHISVLKQDEKAAAEALFKRAQAMEKIILQVPGLSDEERRALLII